jgi:hypothetical protein
MTFGGYFLLLSIFAGLYWLGLKLNPPIEQRIIPEPNNMLRGEDE